MARTRPEKPEKSQTAKKTAAQPQSPKKKGHKRNDKHMKIYHVRFYDLILELVFLYELNLVFGF